MIAQTHSHYICPYELVVLVLCANTVGTDVLLGKEFCKEALFGDCGLREQTMALTTDMLTKSLNVHDRLGRHPCVMAPKALFIKNGQLGSSPSTILPTEIWAEIFECCLPSGPARLETSLQHLAPLILTWVCRTWRELCFSLPTLWTELVLGHRGSDPEGDARLLELWISRARHLPVYLKLNYELDDALRPVLFNRDKNERYFNGMRILLSLAVSCIKQWSTFEIHTLDISVLDQIFLAIVTRGSPQLKKLSFSTKYLGFFGDVHILDFSRCPALQSICLRSPMISPVSQSAVMENMTRLELRFCSSVEDCLQWIDICPALEQLIVRLFCSSPEILSGELERLELRKPRCLPRLKDLEVHSFSIEADVGPLLDLLDVPGLVSFKINMYNMINAPRRWTHILDLIHRSGPPLDVFEIIGTPMAIKDIVECLHLLPGITQLSIGTSWNTDTLVRSLSATHVLDISREKMFQLRFDANCLCPSLKILDLVNSSWSFDLLASTVSSRCAGLPTQFEAGRKPVEFLQELRIDVESASRVKSHPALTQSVALGLNVVGCETNPLLVAFESPQVIFV